MIEFIIANSAIAGWALFHLCTHELPALAIAGYVIYRRRHPKSPEITFQRIDCNHECDAVGPKVRAAIATIEAKLNLRKTAGMTDEDKADKLDSGWDRAHALAEEAAKRRLAVGYCISTGCTREVIGGYFCHECKRKGDWK